ncbi:uncharacterized protein LOC126108447 isoform X2 [Schistocerca cancellata]|uniref:uncharacterized protein LOC126108447 isoform X2 n=1 Tax=Schistocerca cancellata TaxID=274614 RepID=UPI002118898E|nr:uncharacterized protein LOC126108447 isoform X2 [Schistocerca cancellata]
MSMSSVTTQHSRSLCVFMTIVPGAYMVMLRLASTSPTTGAEFIVSKASEGRPGTTASMFAKDDNNDSPAVRASYKIVLNIARAGKPFAEGNSIRTGFTISSEKSKFLTL